MRKPYLLCVLVLLIALIAACSNDTSGEASKEKEKPEEKQEKAFDYPEAATDAEGIIEQGAGEITEQIYEDPDNFDIDKIAKNLRKEFDSMPDDLSAEQLYNYLIAKAAFRYEEVNQLYETFDASYTLGERNGEQEKPKNIVILLDSSGSMAGSVTGGVKMDLAKAALERVVSNLDPSTKVALRVYGHKGSNADKDKKVSCDSSEVVYPLSSYNQENFKSALSKFKPTGWTPIASSINLATEDFGSANGDEFENVMYVISDGIETCDGDPVQAAKKIHESDLKVKVNVIGFDLNEEGRKQMKATAEAGGGEYRDVQSQADIQEALAGMFDEVKEGIREDFDYVREGIALNNWYVDKMNELRKIDSEFVTHIDKESELFDGLIFALEDEGKLKDGVYTKLSDLLAERREVMEQYSQEQLETLKKEVEASHKKAQAELEKRK